MIKPVAENLIDPLLAPKVPDLRKQGKASVVSFFCGCGGLDLGFEGGFKYKGTVYKKLSFELVKSYDFEMKCVQTYQQNISERVEQKDLSSYDVEDVPAADVLIGGFPCQDFSVCGPQAGLESERGQLYKALVRYMKHYQPAVVVAENVVGLSSHDNGKSIAKILKDFKAQGYRFEVWKLYAPDYGVPQTRTRLFLVGVRNDLDGFPVKPEVEFDMAKYRSIRWAIGDLEKMEDETIPNQSQYFKALKAKNGGGQGDEVSVASKPGYTVRANARSRIQFHYLGHRRLTVRECARIQTFPDEFVFPHSTTANIMQLGNAVPPVLAHKVAQAINDFINTLNK